MAKAPAKENQFDAYRETSVVERKTIWSEGLKFPELERTRISHMLHENPQDAKKLEYVRCPTGFVRHITVTQEDIDRLGMGDE